MSFILIQDKNRTKTSSESLTSITLSNHSVGLDTDFPWVAILFNFGSDADGMPLTCTYPTRQTKESSKRSKTNINALRIHCKGLSTFRSFSAIESFKQNCKEILGNFEQTNAEAIGQHLIDQAEYGGSCRPQNIEWEKDFVV